MDDKAINAAMDKGRLVNDAAARAQAWGRIDDEITAQAPAIPFQWGTAANIRSEDVAGVVNLFSSQWDLAFTSLSR